MHSIILDFVEVILPLPLERNFTYAITAAEAQFIKPGFRVAVPFGKRNVYTGIVYKVHQEPPTAYEAKSIHSILDKSPILNHFQFQLWEWISTYYMCTMGEVLRASLPSVFLLESETLISLNLLSSPAFFILKKRKLPSLTAQQIIAIPKIKFVKFSEESYKI